MDAYYYSFDKTGVPEIDRILSAVACAGKAYHHTECWNDDSTPYPGHEGETPAEWIQNAANDAAKILGENSIDQQPQPKPDTLHIQPNKES